MAKPAASKVTGAARMMTNYVVHIAVEQDKRSGQNTQIKTPLQLLAAGFKNSNYLSCITS